MGLDMYFYHKKTKEGINHKEASDLVEIFNLMNYSILSLSYSLSRCENEEDIDLLKSEFESDKKDITQKLHNLKIPLLNKEKLIENLLDEDFVRSEKYYDLVYEIHDIDFGYWRKDNHIHRWFVDNIQEGEDDQEVYEVSLSKMKELRDICGKVLENKELASELLPTSSGFFFGDTSYDKYYFDSLGYTKKLLDEAIEIVKSDTSTGNNSFFYTSWW